ncbi:MAG: GYD domain-containing protein [Thermomicrobiales bacterium]
MATYVMLTRLSPDAITDPNTIKELGQRVTDKLHAECPEAKWISSYAVLGPYDYVDLFEAPDNDVAAKVAVIVRSFGHATTEIWPATPWDRFVEVVGSTSG